MDSFAPFRSERSKAEYEAYYGRRAAAWPVPSETLILDTPSGTTVVRASGRPADPALVLLPGARVSSLMWGYTIAALSAHHRTYALDVIGDAGRSLARRLPLRPGDLVQWLDEVVSALAPDDPVSLMGISYGGWLAGQFAVRRPDRLRSLVLLAPACTVLPISLAFFARVVLLCLPLPGRDAGAIGRTLRWLTPDLPPGDAACRQRFEEAVRDVQMAAQHFALPRPEWPGVLTDQEWQDLRVPCLFLVGERERIYSARAAVERLRRVAPQVTAEMMPGAGHGLTFTQPERLAARVLAFLKQPGPGPGGSPRN
jgi:pimeloyl-ACP methyl ester carboxylesterase